MKRLVLSALVCLMPLSAHAQDKVSDDEALAILEESLPGTLMNNPLTSAWNSWGDDIKAKIVRAPNAPGESAYQVRVKKAKDQAWKISAVATVEKGVAEGETVLIAFWGRAEKMDPDNGQARVYARLQQAAEPYTGVAERAVNLTSDWQIHYLSGVADQNYKDGSLNMTFQIGDLQQTVEFGQFYVMNLGQGVDPSSLPSGSVTPGQ
ncbi:carbohydrate binding domain-containing protein [Parvularcula sp. LCG005]|uniref:carbohydrate binding domain-containing protein n=1 Tax=Parvularcula sp. LCG005 TaxID=3078805 RepID=UPI002942AA99|nr:carbohydrate binding domain-containing protein [Parvularcula sp. LCG005]WOI53477.1 carbohydrate binding domain-containing protein [Parvularcula sp. LCG005]